MADFAERNILIVGGTSGIGQSIVHESTEEKRPGNYGLGQRTR